MNHYHVAYLFPTGHGAAQITTEVSAFTFDGMKKIKAQIEADKPQIGNIVIINVLPLLA